MGVASTIQEKMSGAFANQARQMRANQIEMAMK